MKFIRHMLTATEYMRYFTVSFYHFFSISCEASDIWRGLPHEHSFFILSAGLKMF